MNNKANGGTKLSALLGADKPLRYTKKIILLLMHKGLSLQEISFYAGESVLKLKEIINGKE